MRILSVLTAIIVAAVLYAVVIERDALIAFATGEGVEKSIAIAKGDAELAKAEDTNANADPKIASDAPATQTGHKPVGVVAVHSTASAVDSAVILRGQTAAARQVELRAETSGKVISKPLRKGSLVKEGDMLCALEPGTREVKLAEAEARLAEARAAVPSSRARTDEANAMLDEARINDNAARKLASGGFASDTRVASATAGVRSAEAAVAAAQSGQASAEAAIQTAEANVAAAKLAIEELTLTAPFAGLLESDTAELGTLIQIGGLCATIIQLDPIKLVGFIPESDVARVAVGANAGALLAASGREVMGKVTFLSRSADPQTRTFRVEIEVPNSDLSISDGQTAEIGIESEGAKAHLLPQSALTLNDQGALGVRTISAENTTEFHPVTVLRDSPRGIWLTGLPDTADVIIIGQEFVVSGVPVAPTYQEPTQ